MFEGIAMTYYIFKGYTKDGQKERMIAISKEHLSNEDDNGRVNQPEDSFRPDFRYNIKKVGEIEITGDVNILYEYFPLDYY